MISICVPYWKRQPALDRMLSDYDRLYSGMDIEVSVCDDGSPEPAVVPPGVILTRLPEKSRPLNPCLPINCAVAASSGDVIVLTNPEIEHREPVLGAMLAMLEGPDDYVTAYCWDVDRRTWLAHDSVDYSTHGRLPVPPGAHFHFLSMFSRELWDQAGGFDVDYRHGTACDDNDWLWRLHRAGARFRTCEGVVYHHRAGTGWEAPHNAPLFEQKWGEYMRAQP